jgi:hypothetical protein
MLIAPPQPQELPEGAASCVAHMLLKHVFLSSGKPPG